MKKIVICGAGGHGVEIKTIIEDINEIKKCWEITGFVDASFSVGSLICGLPVVGDDQYLLDCTEPTDVAIAVADVYIRERLFTTLSRNQILDFPSLVHPGANVARNTSLERGVVISQFCIVSPRAALGKFAFLHGGVFVGHDAVIGSYSLVMPHAAILGSVTIGSRCFIGAQASIRQGLSLGENVVVGMGSVVVKDVPNEVVVMGNPARLDARKVHQASWGGI